MSWNTENHIPYLFYTLMIPLSFAKRNNPAIVYVSTNCQDGSGGGTDS